MLDGKGESLKTMAGSFGYAAPEVMRKEGHGKPVDMWSMGVITYTLLCGYSPFRSENLQDLIRECTDNSVVFHERYWKDVSGDAKDFILKLIDPEPDQRWTSEVSYHFCFDKKPELTLNTASIEPHLAHRRERYRLQLVARDQVVPRQKPIQAYYREDQAPGSYREAQGLGRGSRELGSVGNLLRNRQSKACRRERGEGNSPRYSGGRKGCQAPQLPGLIEVGFWVFTKCKKILSHAGLRISH